MQINAIEERTADFFLVAQELYRRAGARLVRVRGKTAGAGILACDQNESSRKRQRALRAGNGNNAIFERLTQAFDDKARKLRKFIQKQNAPMGERYFSRSRNASAANERRAGSGVVRRTKGTRTNKTILQQSGDRIYFSHLQGFILR